MVVPVCLHLLVGFWPLRLKILLASVMISLLLGLGFWQVSRYFEACALQAQLKTPLASVPFDSHQNYPDLTPVTVHGYFGYGSQISLLSKTYEGKNGVVILAPFYLSSGQVVMVNRGWAPSPEAIQNPQGEVEIQGVVRSYPQDSGGWAPVNTPNAWFTINRADLESHWKVDLGAQYIAIDHPEDGLFPHYQYTLKTRDPLRHFNYSLTWFALAFALVVMTFFWIRKSRKH